MDPFVLFFCGIGGVMLHEILTDFFGTRMCNMAVECCREECMEVSDDFAVFH